MASLGHVAVGMAAGRIFTNDATNPKAWRWAFPRPPKKS
jgi:hypothetical protein